MLATKTVSRKQALFFVILSVLCLVAVFQGPNLPEGLLAAISPSAKVSQVFVEHVKDRTFIIKASGPDPDPDQSTSGPVQVMLIRQINLLDPTVCHFKPVYTGNRGNVYFGSPHDWNETIQVNIPEGVSKVAVGQVLVNVETKIVQE